MEYLNSIRAALKTNGTAPVLAIPVPDHAPVCIRAKLLKGALKGVLIESVELTVPWDCRHNDDEDEETAVARLRRMAETLKNARADIRALTPVVKANSEFSAGKQ